MKVSSLLFSSFLVTAGAVTAAFTIHGWSTPDAALLAAAERLQHGERSAPQTPLRKISGTEFDARHRDGHIDVDFEVSLPSIRATIVHRDAHGELGESRTMMRSQHAIQLGRSNAPEFLWLAQNPIAPSRMTGFHVRHRNNHILEYTESDLHQEGLGESWLTMASFGVRAEDFNKLDADGRQKLAFGLPFVCMTAAHPNKEIGAMTELWWNEEYRLPLGWTRQGEDGLFSQELTDLELFVAEEDLLSPQKRWGNYQVMDLVDYREELEFEEGFGSHEHGSHGLGF